MSNWFLLLAAATWKGTLVLLAAWGAVLLLRGRSAAARHLVWTGAAAALLALPFLSVGLPSLPVRAPAAIVDPGLIFRVSTVVSGVPAASSAVAGHAGSQPVRTNFDPRPWIVLIWGAGAAFGLLQMLASWMSLARIRRTAQPLVASDIPVLDAGPGRMPLAFGILRPVILLPSESTGWTDERRAIVLRHELAHIERGDLATHLLARLAFVLHWWNPLSWFAWREFLKERERATDDLVLASGARASDYAAHLLEIARGMQSRDRLSSAAIAMARRSQLEGRLLAILDSGVNRRAVRRTAPLLAAAAAVILIAPLAAIRAQQPASDAANQVKFRSSSGSDSATPGQSANDIPSLVKQGQLAEKEGKAADAEALYAKAASLGDIPGVIPALLYLGYAAERTGNLAAAEGFFEKSFRLDPNGPHAGAALNHLARVKGRQGAGEADAESLFKWATSLQTPGSAASATTMELYAMYLRRQDRNAEADQLDEQARQIYRTRSEQLTQKSLSTQLVHRVGNGITTPGLIFKMEPAYTEEARAAKFQGVVLVYVEVGPDGLAHNISIKKSLGLGLDEKAIEAIQQWKFRPGTVNGEPTTVAATIEVNFRLL